MRGARNDFQPSGGLKRRLKERHVKYFITASRKKQPRADGADGENIVFFHHAVASMPQGDPAHPRRFPSASAVFRKISAVAAFIDALNRGRLPPVSFYSSAQKRRSSAFSRLSLPTSSTSQWGGISSRYFSCR